MKKIISIAMLCAIAMGVMAVPAKRGGIVKTAADGTEKMVYLHGNEAFHYITDADGNWLDEETLETISAERKNTLLQAGEKRMQAHRAAQQKMVGGEPNIAPRGLMIMVNFKDKAFETLRDTVDSMMNGVNFGRHYDYDYTYNGKRYQGTVDAHGSARKYFQDQSYGLYNPEFDVVGPYTVSQNYSYYGSNNDANVGKLIKEACELADEGGADFTLYDNNNDGAVDFVYVLYAGFGEADGGPANTVWPHNYRLTYLGYNLRLDGKLIDNYACSNEITYGSEVYAGIGTFVHEFGHVIGLPDVYSTDNYSVHKTSGMWDIMDYGPYNNEGNTPPEYTAYERFYCGWLTPRVLTEAENVRLQPIDSAEVLLMCQSNTHNLVGYNPNPATFYLVEVRKQAGWDTYIPGEGMLITKVVYDYNTWANNRVNYSGSNMHLDILEADGLAPIYDQDDSTRGWFGKATDAFPAGSTSWTAFANHEMTDITMDANGNVQFKYRGGTTTELVDQAVEKDKVQKIVKDGHVFILRGNKIYDILGHENHQL